MFCFEVAIVSNIEIQKGVSYQNTTPGTMYTDGTTLNIVYADGKVKLSCMVSDIKKVKVQLGTMYIYKRFNSYAISFANQQAMSEASNSLNEVASVGAVTSVAQEAQPEIDKWLQFFENHGVKSKSISPKVFLIVGVVVALILFIASSF